MSLHYIIDGYNIINHPLFAKNHKKVIKDSRKALLEFIRIRRLCGSPKNKITVVFDGHSNITELKQNDNNINVIFSKKETADEKIKKIVGKPLGNAKNIVVVSDDKDIRFFVKALGARSIGIEEFIGAKEKPIACQDSDSIKPELNYSQIQKINQELKKIWLDKHK